MDFSECYGDTVSSVAAAARSGCRARVRNLIRKGSSVDSRDNRGWNALHEAASAGSKECVQEVLSAAAAAGSSSHGDRDYVNSLTHEGESALYLAARQGSLPVVRLLLKAHADINQPTNDLSCPLYAAVDAGHKGIVELLVRKGAEVNGTHTASCWTCLHQAVYKGHSDVVRILVGVCHLEARDDHKITALFLASQYGRQRCLEVLIDAGANVNAQAEDLATPLFIAAQEGYERCVELLLERGADPNLPCSSDWPQLPIHAAAQFGHISILQRLIAVTDRACDRGAAMVSPLYVAVEQRQQQSVELLLQEGYSPDAQDCRHILDHQSPLVLAMSIARDRDDPCSETAKLLLAAGATVCRAVWAFVLTSAKPELMQLVLQHRRIPKILQNKSISSIITEWIQEDTSRSLLSAPDQPEGVLRRTEVMALLRETIDVRFASCWLPLLLQAGLEPSLLVHSVMMEEADSEVLNYLLAFVNWWTLSQNLRNILLRRLDEKTWTPQACFDCVPSLFHLCRLKIRDVVEHPSLIQQLPVPSRIHGYLQFSDAPLPQPSSAGENDAKNVFQILNVF